MIENKVRAICNGPLTPKVNKALEKVNQMLCRRTNQTDPSKSDARYRKANEFYQLAGATPDQVSSPKSISQQNVGFVGEATKSYHTEQDLLFDSLKEVNKLDKNLSWFDGSLKRDGVPLSAEEFCNILDEVSLQYLEENVETDSITGLVETGKDLRKILGHCESILADRIFGGGVIEDDILSPGGYGKWNKYMNTIASVAALTVFLTQLLPM